MKKGKEVFHEWEHLNKKLSAGVRTNRGADRGGSATDLEELVKLYVPQYNWGASSGFGGGGGSIFRRFTPFFALLQVL